MDQFVISEEYCRKIHMRQSITMEELVKWQQWYVRNQTSLTVSPELTEAVDKLFDKIDQGRILVGEL